MRFTYTPVWKGATRGFVICGALGFLAGFVCGLWMPHALVVAAGLVVLAGIWSDDGTVIESSLLFMFTGFLGMITTVSIGDRDAPSAVLAEGFLSATPWQIVWIIPLLVVGRGLRFFARRISRRQ